MEADDQGFVQRLRQYSYACRTGDAKGGTVESIGEVVWKVTVSGGSERMERRVQYEAYSSGWELEHSGCP